MPFDRKKLREYQKAEKFAKECAIGMQMRGRLSQTYTDSKTAEMNELTSQ